MLLPDSVLWEYKFPDIFLLNVYHTSASTWRSLMGAMLKITVS